MLAREKLLQHMPLPAMPIKKPHEYRPDYSVLLLVRMAQRVLVLSREEAQAYHCRLLVEGGASLEHAGGLPRAGTTDW